MKLLNEVVITGSKIVIRAKRLSDAQNDYNWESDPQLADLDAVHPLKISFHRYVNDYSYELKIPFQNSRHFAIDTMDGKHIGNCSYYHISEQDGEAEFGIMIGNRDYWDKGYGEDATRTLVDYIFRTTSLKRIYLKTLESNDRALKCFNKCGFVWCGRLLNEGFNFVVMEILRKQWEAKSPV